jgi:phosphatidyl-myo-inositol alpha-mannosyltransferase
MDVLVAALERLLPDRPELELLVAGRGDADEFLADLPGLLRRRVRLLGQVSEADKARMLASVEVYCAPNTGQESFGVILLEAMAAGTPIAASDLDAFRRVLDGGRAGVLFPTGDPAALAQALALLFDDPARRAELVEIGRRTVAPFDWSVIVTQVLRVYELAIAGASRL